MARPAEPENNTLVNLRISCDDADALANVLRVLEGALGKPARVSKPYFNVGEPTRRVYWDVIVPRGSAAETETK